MIFDVDLENGASEPHLVVNEGPVSLSGTPGSGKLSGNKTMEQGSKATLDFRFRGTEGSTGTVTVSEGRGTFWDQIIKGESYGHALGKFLV